MSAIEYTSSAEYKLVTNGDSAVGGTNANRSVEAIKPISPMLPIAKVHAAVVFARRAIHKKTSPMPIDTK